MSQRVHNFSAGPCTLPLSVLEEGQAEFVNYHDSGMSLIEMSHRGKHFVSIHDEAVDLVRSVYGVPDEFDVLFLQGGATLQFAMVPMNLLGAGRKGGYVNSGTWAKGALTDAGFYGEAYSAWDGSACGFSRMPSSNEIEIKPDTRYLHITSNETIGGVRFADWPEVDVPMIGDMSSDYMSRRIPWERLIWCMAAPKKTWVRRVWRWSSFVNPLRRTVIRTLAVIYDTTFKPIKVRCSIRPRYFQFTWLARS